MRGAVIPGSALSVHSVAPTLETRQDLSRAFRRLCKHGCYGDAWRERAVRTGTVDTAAEQLGHDRVVRGQFREDLRDTTVS